MANLLTITKEPNDYFTFVLNGDTVNAVKNTRNDLLTIGNEAHFKTSQGANLIKEQKILYGNITIVDGATTLVPTSIDDLFSKLISVGFFDWINGTGSGGVNRFDHLLDTFQYFGKDGQGLRVNEAQLKIEPYVLPDVSKLDEFPDTLEAGKMLIVSDDGTEYRFINPPSGSIVSVTGDLVDNTDPANPVILHDDEKLDKGGYEGTAQDLKDDIDSIVQTTAGVYNRINFTGDPVTITAGTFYHTDATSKGSVSSVIQSVVNDDNQKKYFAQDLIGNAFPALQTFPAGIYAGHLSVRVSPNSAQQRYTIEIYKANNGGTPIASGITGAPVGSLGVTVVAILDSGIINLADNAITSIPLSGQLLSQLSIATGERIRYHVSAEKVGTASSNITMEVFYGSSYNSYYDVPVTFSTDNILNKSAVSGATETDALNQMIHKGDAPQVKTGGLTIGGTTLSRVNDKWYTFGTSVTNGGKYTVPAAANMNVTLINNAVDGSNSNDLVNHYSQIPTLTTGNKDQYRLISFEYGINDIWQSIPLATFRTNLTNGILQAKSKAWPNNKILIINSNFCTSEPMFSGLEAYANEAILIAKEQGVQYYDVYNYTKNNGGGSLLSDGVHPNTIGGKVYARGLVASLQGGLEVSGALNVVDAVFSTGLKYNKAIDIVGQDLNNLTDAGFYSGITLTNVPFYDYWYVTVERNATDVSFCRQTISSFGWQTGVEKNATYSRVMVANTWQPWIKTVKLTSAGNLLVNTTTDNGVDKGQFSGTVLSTGFKVAGTTGFLKSEGTVDTVISTIGNSVGINQAVPESTLHIGDGNAILLDRYKNGSAGASNFLGRAYNGTKLLPTTLLDNQDIAIFGANPYNGIDAEGHKAGLKFTTNGVQTASNRGTKVDISITPLNATTPSASVFNADSNRVLLSDASISLSTPVAVGWFGKGEIAGENPHKFQVVSEGLNPTVSFGQFGGVGSAGNAGGHLWASRGTVTSPSAIQSGDYLWSWGFRGQGATTRAPSSANMSIRATENFTDTAHGTEIRFGTNATGHDANLGRTSEFVMQQDGGFLAPHHLVESYSALGQNGSYRFKDHPSNPDSRSWRIGNDYDDFGDFAILQSTTKTGTFFSKKFSIDPVGVVGIGNLAGTGTRQVVADEDGKLSDMPIRRTFSTVVSWTGTYAGSTADYIMDRETGHFNNPNFVDTVNFGNYLYVPFKCKIKAVVHGGNALGTPVLLKISKVVTSTTFDLLASKSVGTYANSPVGSVFTYGTDIDSTKTIDAGGQVMISFNNNNISTGVWRSPLLTIYFEEEF